MTTVQEINAALQPALARSRDGISQPSVSTSVPVTSRSNSYFKAAGWARIVKVEVERWFDDDRIDFAIVWLTDDEGNVWEASIKTGETEAQVGLHYANRGYTDGRACLAFEAGA